MRIRSKFQGKHTKNCILKTVSKKNATVFVKMFPKNYLFCIPTNFLPHIFDIFTQIYLPYLRYFATLPSTRSFEHFEKGKISKKKTNDNCQDISKKKINDNCQEIIPTVQPLPVKSFVFSVHLKFQ